VCNIVLLGRKASLEDEMKALIAGLACQVKHLGEKRDIIPSRRAVEAEEDKVKPNKVIDFSIPINLA
jgi:hypothetical protein